MRLTTEHNALTNTFESSLEGEALCHDGSHFLALVSDLLSSLVPRVARLEAHMNRYNTKLAARPLLTQSVTTAVLFATGDVTAQQLVDKRGINDHDLKRTGRMALYGGCTLSSPASPFFPHSHRY